MLNYVSNLVSINEKKQYIIKTLSIHHINCEYFPTSIKPKKKIYNDILIESNSFDIISKLVEKNNKFDKAALSLEKGFNKSIQKEFIYSPKMTDDSEDKFKMKMINEDLKIYSTNFNYLYFKNPMKLYVNSPISFETFPKKKLFFSMDTQTLLIGVKLKLKKSEIDKINSLNEEYNNELISNKLELQQLHKFYEEQIQSYQEEISNSKSFELLQPEMIPPEQTIKIFLCNCKNK